MRNDFLPFYQPLIGDEEVAEVVDTLRSQWLTTGAKVRAFEQQFAEFVGGPSALAVSSCTAALHVALAALGAGPGDAILTTPMTFCSTVHVVEHVGATPILVDIEPDTMNLDPHLVEETLTRLIGSGSSHGLRPRLLLPVHFGGHPVDTGAFLELARDHDLAIVEDAAHALPSEYQGTPVGSVDEDLAHAACFSFYPTKNMTTAEGGMLVGSAFLVEEARRWSLHGLSHDAWDRYSGDRSWHYDVTCAGFKYNMTDLQAAIGIHQLRRLPTMQARRSSIARRYNEAFGPIPELETPVVRPGARHSWHLYVLRLVLERLRISRSEFIEELRVRGIGASVHFIPVHLHHYYVKKYGYFPSDYPEALKQYRRVISLPLYPRMSDRDVGDVIDAVIEIVDAFRA